MATRHRAEIFEIQIIIKPKPTPLPQMVPLSESSSLSAAIQKPAVNLLPNPSAFYPNKDHNPRSLTW
jgi:hypothetical protein